MVECSRAPARACACGVADPNARREGRQPGGGRSGAQARRYSSSGALATIRLPPSCGPTCANAVGLDRDHGARTERGTAIIVVDASAENRAGGAGRQCTSDSGTSAVANCDVLLTQLIPVVPRWQPRGQPSRPMWLLWSTPPSRPGSKLLAGLGRYRRRGDANDMRQTTGRRHQHIS